MAAKKKRLNKLDDTDQFIKDVRSRQSIIENTVLLYESPLADTSFYKNLFSDRALTNEIGELNKEVKAIKMANNDNLPDIAIQRMKDSDRELYNQMKELSEEERSAKLSELEQKIADIKARYKEVEKPINIATKVVKLEPARQELEEAYSERTANQIITMYVALLEEGIPSKKGNTVYEKEFILEPTDPENSKYTAEELTEEALKVLRNMEQAVKYPDLIKVWVTHVLDTDEFHETWSIDVENARLGIIAKIEASKDGSKFKDVSATSVSDMPEQDLIVGSDDTWVTYHAPDIAASRRLKKFYDNAPHTRDDQRLKKSGSQPGWCVTSSADFFKSYKRDDDEAEWFITYSLKNPIDHMLEWLDKNNGFTSDGERDNFIADLEDHGLSEYNGASLSRYSAKDLKDMFFGEICLRTDYDDNRDGGIHLWRNSGSGRNDSKLVPSLGYGYDEDSLKVGAQKALSTDKGILTSYKGDAEFFFVPFGIREIGDGAFAGNDKIKAVHLPSSVTSIGDKAFANCSNLALVSVSHNLHEVAMSAFYGIEGRANLGVLKIEDGVQYLDKPRSLRWYPDELAEDKGELGFDEKDQIIQDALDESLIHYRGTNRIVPLLDIKTEADAKLKGIDFKNTQYRKKRRLYMKGPEHPEYGMLWYVENGKVYFNEKIRRKVIDSDLELPEGVLAFGSPIYASFPNVRLPRSFKGFSNMMLREHGPIFDLVKVPGEVDMSNTSIVEIPADVFGSLFVGTLKLPRRNFRVLYGRENTGGALAKVKAREIHISVSNLVDPETFVYKEEHERTFEGLASPLLRKIYTDDASLFMLLGGKYSSPDEIPAGSIAEKIYNSVKVETLGTDGTDDEEENQVDVLRACRNRYVASSRFRATVSGEM